MGKDFDITCAAVDGDSDGNDVSVGPESIVQPASLVLLLVINDFTNI